MARLGDEGLASHLIGRAMLQAASCALGARAIPVMPLKGIWLQHFVYVDDPGARLITDVDILVPDEKFPHALATLQAAGWELRAASRSEAALQTAAWPLSLDLHRSLFPRGAFNMSNRALFERGTLDREMYETEVVSPDPLDVFAHLIGHFVKRRGAWITGAAELRDLPRIATRFELSPSATARRLLDCGLARAALYVLQCVPPADDPAGFCARTLASLRSDRVGSWCATTMLRLRDEVGFASPFAALPGFVLEQSIPRALSSALLRGWDRLREN